MRLIVHTAAYSLMHSEIVGHAHLTVQKMQSADSTALLDPTKFAFFKGLDFADGQSNTRRSHEDANSSERYLERRRTGRLGGGRVPSLHHHV